MLGSLFGSKKAPKQQGNLSVFVIEARNLKKAALGTSRDPYVELRLVSTVGNFIRCTRTRVIPKTLAPLWINPPEEHIFPVAIPMGDDLEVSLYDKVVVGLNNELLGKFTLPVKAHIGVQVIDNWYSLGNNNGELHIVSMYHGEQQTPLPPPPTPEWTLGYDKVGRLHYINNVTGATSWTCPVVQPQPAMVPPQQYAAPLPDYAAQQQPTAPMMAPAVMASAPSPVDPAAAAAATAPAAPPMYPPIAPQQPVEDVNAFLTTNGMAHLIPVFAKEHIDMMVLRSLSEADMTALGLAFGDKRKLLLLLGK